MIKTVIFDMDGVIVDTEPVHHYAFNQHFKELNIEVSPEMYASFTGNSTKNVFEKLKLNFGLKHDIDVLINRKRELFNDAFDKKEDLCLLKGVLDLIQELHKNGIQLVLASSSAKITINRIFARFGLHQYFSHIVSGEDFPKSKPDPAIFLHAAFLSKTNIKNCIVIEDSTNGIKAAKSAGIFCVGYDSPNSKLQDYSLADIVISDFEELTYEKILNSNFPSSGGVPSGRGGFSSKNDSETKIIQAKINNAPIYRNFVTNLPYNSKLKDRARALRKAGVMSEVIFWRQVHKGIFWKIDFDRQRIIGNFIVDFYVKTLGLIVEIDGSSHNNKEVYDEKRDQYFKSLKLRIFRVSDFRIHHDLGNVMNELEQFIIKEYGGL